MNITVSNGLDGLLASVRKQVEQKWSKLGDVAVETAEFGAKTAQSYTASRPGATTGKAGRIQTGDMIDALRAQPVSFSPDLIETRYGFVNELAEYMRFQTITGFRHNRSGAYIAPTFALRDSIGPTRAFAVANGNAVA